MADKPMDVYLNDHLAGAMLGSDLAEQIAEQNEGTPLGQVMGSLAPEIEADRQTLIDLMEEIGTSKNPVKQMTTWVAEKASRPKFSGFTSGEPELGNFMALETLTLGVEGKASLWRALKLVESEYDALSIPQLETLIERADAQRDALEQERLAAAKLAFPGESGGS